MIPLVTEKETLKLNFTTTKRLQFILRDVKRKLGRDIVIL